MLFVELRFFAFFAVVAALYWLMTGNLARKRLLLLASYIFYGAWDWRFLALILFCSLLNYGVALALERSTAPQRRRRLLWAAIAGDLGVLFCFKYFNFFATSLADLGGYFGAELGTTTLTIVLPVGISFYTFQAMSYVIDVYRREIRAEPAFLDVALYIAFFPQLVAGPIVRAADFLPQLQARRSHGDVALRACLLLFLVGFVKKACISDNIAPYVDQVFANPQSYAADQVVAGILLYAVQIFCDFSGYSDMAIATAGLLGYHFPRNFNAPYLAVSVADFWHRWHISLSSWLRDYLYVPLGGNRQGPWKRDRNLMITMILGGLWHGAAYNFVIWGFLHGLALIAGRESAPLLYGLKQRFPAACAVLGCLLTLYWVCLAWIFFRAGDLAQALTMSWTYLTWQSPGSAQLAFPAWPFLAGLALLYLAGQRGRLVAQAERLHWPAFSAGYGAACALALAGIASGYRPFIYFQF
jgi:D-alanyl-lipoteichoic acid acyltransferase DltB (MBOAT superfamily)